MKTIFGNIYYLLLLSYVYLSSSIFLKVFTYDASYYGSISENGTEKRRELYKNVSYAGGCAVILILFVAYVQTHLVGEMYTFDMPTMLLFYTFWIIATYAITIHPSLVSTSKSIDTEMKTLVNDNRFEELLKNYKIKCEDKKLDLINEVNDCKQLSDDMYSYLNIIKGYVNKIGSTLDIYSGTLYDAMARVELLSSKIGNKLVIQESLNNQSLHTISSILHYGSGLFIVAVYIGLFDSIFNRIRFSTEDLSSKVFKNSS